MSMTGTAAGTWVRDFDKHVGKVSLVALPKSQKLECGFRRNLMSTPAGVFRDNTVSSYCSM